MNVKKEQPDRKKYVKPQLTAVRLVAGEAVLATCKTGPAGQTDCQSTYGERCGTASPHS